MSYHQLSHVKHIDLLKGYAEQIMNNVTEKLEVQLM